MKKLTKRQIIILMVMAVVIIYALYDFLSPNPTKTTVENPVVKRAELNTFVTGFSADIGKDLPNKFDGYIVSRAETPWMGNPFNDTKLYNAWSGAKEPAASTASFPKHVFTYTGYLEGPSKKIAIINGLEFSPGETLDIPGYALKEIYPSRVVILNKKENVTINVPLQE